MTERAKGCGPAGAERVIADLVWRDVQRSGLRQADVCAMAGISQKHLSRYFNGHNGMMLSMVDHVLAQLGRELVISTRPLRDKGE